jgi:tight adherence protein B
VKKFRIGVGLYAGVISAAPLTLVKTSERLAGLELINLGIAAGSFLLVLFLLLIEIQRRKGLRSAWRRRSQIREGIKHHSLLKAFFQTKIQHINRFLQPIYRRGPGRVLFSWWVDGGFGNQPLPFTLGYLGLFGLGSLGGYLATRSYLLSGFFGFLLLVGFSSWLYSRARSRRQLFQDQFPALLDRLADSMQAGFSLPQAVKFLAPNLSEPSASEMTRLLTQLKVGFSIEQALLTLYQRQASEDLRLLVQGITLQRQVGGNMIELIRKIAELIRQRAALGNEIRSLTAQGRLSAIVIACLVPASLGLLTLFPGYVDVLFNTSIGNLVLITVGILELLGALILSRLMRVEV